jgi:hypothetical protein
MTDESTPTPTPDVQALTPRDDARAKIFSGESAPLNVPVIFRGISLELRQPTWLQMLSLRDEAGGDERQATIRFLIQFAYLQGTNERVFDNGDYDKLANLRMDGELSGIIQAIGQIMNAVNGETVPS